MTGSWRLLAAFLLVLVAVRLRAQDAADRAPAPNSSSYSAANTISLLRPTLLLPSSNPVSPGVIAFRQVVRSAGIIFSGRVISIGTSASSASQVPASTAVTFRVEHAIRGVSPGQKLVIHEWAGLWARGERYRVGERVALFLYRPGRLGLTSPVSGSIGRFAMESRDDVLLVPQHLDVFAVDRNLRGERVIPYAELALAVRRFGPEGPK